MGASDAEGKPNTGITRQLRRWAEHHGASLYPVNPSRDSVDGLPAVPSLDALAGLHDRLDVVVILVGDVAGALAQALDAKARFAVIFAAGYAEVGGEGVSAQERLAAMLEGSDLRLLGPNTNLNAFEMFREDLQGPALALITQSGHQGRPVFQAQEIGVRLAYWAPTGNEADLEFADFASWFATRPEVGVIASYMEGFKDGATFRLAADQCMARQVPIVMVKVGRTERGSAMAMSHTGHLTGSDAVVEGVFRQHGVIRVDGLDELVDTAAMLARSAPPARRLPGIGDRLDRLSPSPRGGVCVYSISGGTSAHMADLCEKAGLDLPQLSEATQRQLHEWIPPYLQVANPVDNGGHPVADWRGRRILETILADDAVDVLVCPIAGAFPPHSDHLVADLVAVGATTDKPICVIWGSPAADEAAYREVLLPSGLPVFRTFSNCIGALKAYFDYHGRRLSYRSPFREPAPGEAQGPPVVHRPATTRRGVRPLRGGSTLPMARRARSVLLPGATLSERDSKQVLSAYGIPVSRDLLVGSASEAARAGTSLGFPVVMKVCSAQIAHKSDLGLVQVGVSSAAEARRTYRSLVERAARLAPKADVEGVLVSEMVVGGVEAVVGVVQDELFGPAVMVGLGGVLVEVLQDISVRVPPFGPDEAYRMLGELRGRALLEGARGGPPLDVDTLAEAVVRVGHLASDLADEISELDVNPLMVMPRGVVALDALVVCSPR